MFAKHKIEITILLSVCLILLIKLTFPTPAVNKELTNGFWIIKTHSPKKYDIIICGDSRIYRGISAQEIALDNACDYSAYNLGYSSAGLSDEYLDFAISKLNTKNQHPILVIGVTPHSLTQEAFKNKHYNSIKNLKPFEVFKGLYLSSQLLKYFAPYEPCELINGEKINYQQKYNNDGWVASSYVIPDSTKALKSYTKTFNKYQVGNKETKSFISKIKEITSTNITVVAFRPPSTQRMRQLEDSISGFDENLVKHELIKNSVQWLEFKDSDFQSYDGSHLDVNSGIKLSKIISEKISKICLSENQ